MPVRIDRQPLRAQFRLVEIAEDVGTVAIGPDIAAVRLEGRPARSPAALSRRAAGDYAGLRLAPVQDDASPAVGLAVSSCTQTLALAAWLVFARRNLDKSASLAEDRFGGSRIVLRAEAKPGDVQFAAGHVDEPRAVRHA